MSDQIIEQELIGFIGMLQHQKKHAEAARLDMQITMAKGCLAKLVELRDFWADKLVFEQNTRRRILKSGNLIIRCKRGLWSCEGPDHDKVQREAMNYFLQYYEDGEYD